jgi:DNA-directed RNA polymerase subunit RPC12/RpoP
MADATTFQQDLDTINEAFAVTLDCDECGVRKLMKIDLGMYGPVYRCVVCGTARNRGLRI